MDISLPPPSQSWDLSDPTALHALDPIGESLFQSRTRAIDDNPHLFGGQIIAQSIAAATATVTDRPIHSLHGYFLSAGDGRHRLHFQVERLRDGGRFSNRRVTVTQGNRHLFEMFCSFHAPRGDSPRASNPMPRQVPDPGTREPCRCSGRDRPQRPAGPARSPALRPGQVYSITMPPSTLIVCPET